MNLRRTVMRRPQGSLLPIAHGLSTDRRFVGSYLGTNWPTKPAEIRAKEEQAGVAQGSTAM